METIVAIELKRHEKQSRDRRTDHYNSATAFLMRDLDAMPLRRKPPHRRSLRIAIVIGFPFPIRRPSIPVWFCNPCDCYTRDGPGRCMRRCRTISESSTFQQHWHAPLGKPLGHYLGRLRRVAHRFDAMPVRIENEGSEVVRHPSNPEPA